LPNVPRPAAQERLRNGRGPRDPTGGRIRLILADDPESRLRLVLAQDGDRHSEHHMIGRWVRFGNLRAGEPGRPVAQLPCSSAQSLPIGCGGRARQIILVLSNLALDQPQAARCHQIAMRADRTIRQSDHARIGIILFDEGTTHRIGHSG
jgi:hypothetical protein